MCCEVKAQACFCHATVLPCYPSYSLFSGWNLDPLQCTMASEYGYIQWVSDVCIPKSASSGATMMEGYADLQENSESTFIWEIVCPMLFQDLTAALLLPPWTLLLLFTHRKTCPRSARGQPFSNSSFILSIFPFICPLSGTRAGPFISRSSFLSRQTCHPCYGICSEERGFC